MVIQVDTEPTFELSANDLYSLTSGTRAKVLFAHPERTADGRKYTRALLHVPYGELSALADKCRRYANDQTDKGNVPNQWVANLRRIARAALRSLWTDPEPFPEDGDTSWWELWVRRDTEAWARFEYHRVAQNVRIKGDRLVLPEHFVVIVQATRAQLEASIDILNTLSEVRRARTCHVELSHLRGDEQHEWIELAAARIQPPPDTAPAVCLLDTGINRGHALLSRVLAEADNHTRFADGDPSDSDPEVGHGTPMAGLAAFGDINALALGTTPWLQLHRLEGVKTFDENRKDEPSNYGSVTVQAVHTPEIANAERARVYCMAITVKADHDGRPSSWSAAIDSLAFGAEEPDEPKRLFVLAAGNTTPFDAAYTYPGSNERSPIQDPAQAWNAITVGAVTHRDRVLENDPESTLLRPLAPGGALSPHSRTSLRWDPHWPIKPEIVIEGGNLATHHALGVERRDSLDLLTTSKLIFHRPLVPFRATSAATALASRLAAEIMAEYPSYWPETIRGLIVHSARWNSRMLQGADPHAAGTQDTVVGILRRYGYGEPDLGRARACAQNAVTLIRQDELTPYAGSAGSAKINDCHVHQLRLPAELLQSLGETDCTLRVTLSYFVAPNPSASNRIPGSRYRYGGGLLRFRIKHRDESDDNFMALVSREAEADDDEGDDRADPDSLHDSAWALGWKLRGKSGSLVQDVWRGPAANLVTMDRIAIFPVKGWWAVRSFPDEDSPWHHCHKRTIRYSLIISVETLADVPLYNEISNLLSVPVDA
ncbi:MAG TPA: S8 family peptidase [Bryobacteraceae bacterium]|nr:S8 family peptidase [Bryobacteraceae bacterium]